MRSEPAPPTCAVVRHSVGRTALFFGVVYLGLAATFAIDEIAHDFDAGWAWATGFLVIGVAGLVVTVSALAHRDPTADGSAQN